MKRALCLLVAIGVVSTGVVPALGQRTRKERYRQPIVVDRRQDEKPKPAPKPNVDGPHARFASVEALSEGQGVYVRWRTESELKNLGFRVMRYGRFGAEPVSSLVLGSKFSVGDQQLSDGEYFYFDREGDLNSAYLVEAVLEDGQTVPSTTFSSAYVPAIETVEGGDVMKADATAFKSGLSVEENGLILTSELQTEQQLGSFTQNPTKHLEVISQSGARISAKAKGLIRVTKAELLAAGFDANGSAANWQLYQDGVEIPVLVGANNDYIEFIGKELETNETDIRTYYLINGQQAGKRMLSSVFRRPLNSVVGNRYNYTLIKKERTSYLSQLINGDDPNFFGTGIVGPFPGAPLSAPTNIPFSLTGVDRTPGTRRVTVRVQGSSLTAHAYNVFLNGTQIGQLSGFGRQNFAASYDVPVELLLEGANAIGLQETYIPAPNTAVSISFFDTLTIDAPRKFEAVGNHLSFYTENYKNARVSGFTTPNVRLFDVTYETEPRVVSNVQASEVSPGNYGFTVPAGRGRVYLAVGDDPALTTDGPAAATSVTANNPEVYGSAHPGAEFVIIKDSMYSQVAADWAAYRSGQGTSVRVVDIKDIFDEFSYGASRAQSIEDFLMAATQNWQTPPKYVLLIGDASYDPRNYQGHGGNQVPTRMVVTVFSEAGSDESLGDFNNDGFADVAIGRIAVRNATDAQTILNKTIAWEAWVSPTAVQSGALMVNDVANDHDFPAINSRLMTHLPASATKTVVSFDNAGESALRRQVILDTINGGEYLMNYTGHGIASAWKGSNYFHNNHIPLLTNSQPTFFMALTCLNGLFAHPRDDSLSEVITKRNGGGAVAAWASSGLTTPDVQEIMASRFFDKITDGSIVRLGDLIKDSKAALPSGTGNDVKLSWALIGDPMLKMR